MKLFFASDIHGSAPAAERVVNLYRESGAEKLVLLGDILYHGPRNDLPEGYAPKKVCATLNPLKDDILCVRGNCEAEVDQMVLSFPCLAEYAVLFVDGLTLFLTHGHVWNEDRMPPLAEGEILIHGHTHIPCVTESGGHLVLNPGSVSLPKEGWPRSCMVCEDGLFRIFATETKKILMERSVGK